MDALKPLPAANTPTRLGLSDQTVQAAFAATLFASALLLFSVQPMFARMALPKLGGAPAVWAVSMCFFQAALLAGYGYAWALNRYLPPLRAVQAHLTLLLATTLALPIGLPMALGEPPAGDAYLWLLGVLGLGVGLPFFAVSANAPLLQAWFARTGHPDARDPYFLYGASNIGSLLALLAYPLAIEPTLGLAAQTATWSVGFALLAAAIAACGLLMVLRLAPGDQVSDAIAASAPAEPVTWSQRGLWVALSLIPSGLLVATTTHIATDIASAPLIWVIPLALFLATFIVTFREHLVVSKATLGLLLLVAMTLSLVVGNHMDGMVVALAAFLFAALLCHRELYERRPAAAHLTEFYVWMSVGGVIGGILAALVAPQVFTRVAEYPLLLAAAALCRPGVIFERPAAVTWRHIASVAISAAIVVAVLGAFGPKAGTTGADLIARLAPIGIVAMILFTKQRADHALLVTVSVIALLAIGRGRSTDVMVDRSFFGTIRVYDTADGQHRIMMHGTTAHGMRRLKTPDGQAVTTPVPATYYHPSSPMARGVGIVRAVTGKTEGGLAVGIVGLGTGSLACYARPGDAWRLYEIDPAVVRMARDPDLFGFVPRCAPHAPIIVGDARLTLAREHTAPFDYLVIDAFSSDAVPAHLLTREAFALYLSKLSPTGLVALHVSNRYLDLVPAVLSTAATIPGVTAISAPWTPANDDRDGFSSVVVFLMRDTATATAIEGLGGTTREAPSVTPWTDDFSDVLSAIVRRLRKT